MPIDATKPAAGSALSSAEIRTNFQAVVEELANKVDKVQGKGLSANDFTDQDKQIVEGVPEALGDKQDTLVSGQNIKTLNGESLLGEGNIVVGGGFNPYFRLNNAAEIRRFYAQSVTTVTVSNNALWLTPVTMDADRTITEIGLNVNGGIGGGVARVFVFGSNPDGTPNLADVILSGIELSTTTPGDKFQTCNLSFEKGALYYFGFVTAIAQSYTVGSKVANEFWVGNTPRHTYALGYTYTANGIPTGVPTLQTLTQSYNAIIFKGTTA